MDFYYKKNPVENLSNLRECLNEIKKLGIDNNDKELIDYANLNLNNLSILEKHIKEPKQD